MRSRFAERFNHDEEAAGYDRDVLDAENPIRTGYDELLDWVARTADTHAGSSVLELGAGTGNLALRLGLFKELVCVDISAEMMRIGREKLAAFAGVRWVSADLLEFFDRGAGPFDVVVSTYAIHHLTEPEKGDLFRRIWSALATGGTAVFGDLMFADCAERARVLESYRGSGRSELADEVAGEFFWDVELALTELWSVGFAAEAKRFSELSWGLVARKPAGSPRR